MPNNDMNTKCKLSLTFRGVCDILYSTIALFRRIKIIILVRKDIKYYDYPNE